MSIQQETFLLSNRYSDTDTDPAAAFLPFDDDVIQFDSSKNLDFFAGNVFHAGPEQGTPTVWFVSYILPFGLPFPVANVE